VVPSRSSEKLDALASSLKPEYHSRFLGIEAPYNTFIEAAGLAEEVSLRVGPVTDVVALIGGWWMGKSLVEITEAEWQQVFVGPATTHMSIAHAFLPRMSPTGSYTAVAGFAAKVPSPSSGPVSMQAAAQLMMRKVLSAEISDGPRINDIMLGPVINRSRPQGRAEWITAEEVGLVLTQIMRDSSLRNTQIDVQTRDSFNAFIKQ
jgi:3-oxoacyl-[acyl-carrier protein] reductase